MDCEHHAFFCVQIRFGFRDCSLLVNRHGVVVEQDQLCPSVDREPQSFVECGDEPFICGAFGVFVPFDFAVCDKQDVEAGEHTVVQSTEKLWFPVAGSGSRWSLLESEEPSIGPVVIVLLAASVMEAEVLDTREAINDDGVWTEVGSKRSLTNSAGTVDHSREYRRIILG